MESVESELKEMLEIGLYLGYGPRYLLYYYCSLYYSTGFLMICYEFITFFLYNTCKNRRLHCIIEQTDELL